MKRKILLIFFMIQMGFLKKKMKIFPIEFSKYFSREDSTERVLFNDNREIIN